MTVQFQWNTYYNMGAYVSVLVLYEFEKCLEIWTTEMIYSMKSRKHTSTIAVTLEMFLTNVLKLNICDIVLFITSVGVAMRRNTLNLENSRS